MAVFRISRESRVLFPETTHTHPSCQEASVRDGIPGNLGYSPFRIMANRSAGVTVGERTDGRVAGCGRIYVMLS
jgi:hypothetical protein